MSLDQIAILALIQGLAELLPVSSSAHVILAQKLMGLDPGAPEMTFLLVMLHTGTMFAVLFYFGRRWKKLVLDHQGFIRAIVIATAATGVLGFGLKLIIEKLILERWLGHSKGEVEHLFRVLPMIALALFSAGILIVWSGRPKQDGGTPRISDPHALKIGLVQGLCLPFRGFSRSGATISAGMKLGVSKVLAEEFSFALAVVLTPPVIVLQLRRLLKAKVQSGMALDLPSLLAPGIIGMVLSFAAGLLALRWLSAWLERGRWVLFGYYCFAFSAIILVVGLTSP